MTHEQIARAERLMDSNYAAGLKAGWNLANSDDLAGYQARSKQGISGWDAVIAEAREHDALDVTRAAMRAIEQEAR